MKGKDSLIRDKVDRMTLDQKVGALLSLGFNGTIVTPNIYEYVTKYLEPTGEMPIV